MDREDLININDNFYKYILNVEVFNKEYIFWLSWYEIFIEVYYIL